ncbi:MAG TPA: GGDEF domain-containing protein, partial [Magnetococcales bacterium]|nr:GGDEF domain-containing protein [Magnetococcales bacterium]
GLPNRRHFMTEGEKLHAQACAGDITLIAAAVDVDFFKKVNDTYGHEAGDQVLKKVAALLARHSGAGNLIARMGGEEFSILLVNKNLASAIAFFERLRSEIQSMDIFHNEHIFHITASFGVCGTLGASLAEMLDRADQKLYNAKEAGRNRVEVAE